MQERTVLQEHQAHVDDGALPSRCSGCSTIVLVHLADLEVSTGAGSRFPVTYADTDIVVWDCPACSHANADVLRET